MKYKKSAVLVEDKEILENRPLIEISRITGYDMGYLSRVKTGKLIPSEDWYNKLKILLTKHNK